MGLNKNKYVQSGSETNRLDQKSDWHEKTQPSQYRNLPRFNQLGQYNNIFNVNFGKNYNDSDIKLGCDYNKNTKSVEFGVYSKNATHINLYLFDKPVQGKVIKKIEMDNHDGKWVAKLDKEDQIELNINVKNGDPIYYGYRAWGPNWEYDEHWTPGSDVGFKSHVDENGNRFNPNKLLFDPRSTEISHDPISPKAQGGKFLDDSIYATEIGRAHV